MQIIISVHGGTVQGVYASPPGADIILIDWDVQDCDADVLAQLDLPGCGPA